MTITEYNIPKEQKDFIDHIKQELKEYFVKNDRNKTEVEGNICIIADYPLLFNTLGRINLLVLISITYGNGNWFKVGDKFLNTLAFGIRFIKDDSIIEIDESCYYDEDGAYDYKKALVNEAKLFNRKVKELGSYEGRITVQFMDWVSSNNLRKYNGMYAYGNKRPRIKELIENICSRIKYKSIDSFGGRSADAPKLTSILLNIAEQQNKSGIILKGKINAITKKNTAQYYQRLEDSIGTALSIIKGPAGAGKTQLLTQLIYDYAKNKSRHIRLLTYNKMLVKDLRLQLRSLLNTEVRSVSISTVDKFFYGLCEDLTKKISDPRSEELIKKCERRIELAKQILDTIDGDIGSIDEEIRNCIKENSTKLNIKDSDIEEIVGYLKTPSDQRDGYLDKRKEWIREMNATDIYIRDKYYVLFLYYRDVLNGDVGGNVFSREFIESAVEKDSYYRYDPSDCKIEVSKQAKWSKIICIDEAQDLHILEKLILFNLRERNEYNLVVALSGKDQIVRNIKETNWTSMYGKPVKHIMIQLRKHSYRQKRNIISFINAFCEKVGLQNDMTSTIEGGRVILDVSNRETYPQKLKELNDYGNGCGCSNYESLICLVPPLKDYIDYGDAVNMASVSTNDTINQQKRYPNKCLKHSDELKSVFEYYYDGVATDKDPIITQQHTRIIHYESCRGLEAWTTACLDIDGYFDVKVNSQSAIEYALSTTDIFSSSLALYEQYAYQICVLAFTRAIDTLYIKIKNPSHKLSKILISLSKTFDFIEVI